MTSVPRRVSYHAGGKDSIGALLAPGHDRRSGGDYVRANRAAIRILQRDVKARKEEEDEAVAASQAKVFKMSRFRDVPSRLYAKKEEEVTDEVAPHDGFLRRGAANQRAQHLRDKALKIREKIEAQGAAAAEAQMPKEKPPVPRFSNLPENDRIQRQTPTTKNFVEVNRKSATLLQPPPQAQEEPAYRHASQGQVPEYLAERQKQWAEDEAAVRACQPDPHAPPGTVLMSDEERFSTLIGLKEREVELRKQLNSLPLVIQTERTRRRQAEIDAQLAEVEHSIVMFSKPKVYVAP